VRYYQNVTTICKYCKDFDHVIEEYPILMEKKARKEKSTTDTEYQNDDG